MSIEVNCPTCGKSIEWKESNLYRPFCSERCKLIDLGEWASENRTIEGSPLQLPELYQDDEFE